MKTKAAVVYEPGKRIEIEELDLDRHAAGLDATYPAYAAYLRKYVSPAKLRFSLSDSASGAWFELALNHDVVTMDFRATRDGHFAPLTGAVRPMPDSLQLLSDIHGKVWIFSVGMSELLADFTVIHSAHERGWDFRFHHDPHWHLPLFADHFVKTPLRRPFAGDGTRYRVTVRDSANAESPPRLPGIATVTFPNCRRDFPELPSRLPGIATVTSRDRHPGVILVVVQPLLRVMQRRE